MRVKEWKLSEHFLMTAILTLTVIVFYAVLLYAYERKVICIPKQCAESSGQSNLPGSGPDTTPTTPFTNAEPGGRIKGWTWEVRTSTDQRDAWLVPSPAE